MKIYEASLPGVKVFEPKRASDLRGYFFESWNEAKYLGIKFVQDNVSFSQKNVLRGLHMQWPNPQGKLVSVLSGSVYDVFVDVRQGSPHFGKWGGMELSAENGRQIYIPEGFLHGFCVNSENAIFTYKVTGPYHKESEVTVRWDDPTLNIAWPHRSFIVSEKDELGRTFKDLTSKELPLF